MKMLEGWEWKELDALVLVDQESLDEDIKRVFSFYYIDISSVFEGKLRLPSSKTIFRDAPSRAIKTFHLRDVLMSTVRPNLKAFAYFDHTNDDCIASTGSAVLTARDQVDSRFILYAILSDSVTDQIEAHVVGSNYPAINSNDVRRLHILTPPFSEQTKIAEVLSTVDQAIEQTEALIAKQQRIKTGLMQDLLTRGIDEHDNLRSEQTHEFKDSPLGMIPVEWEAPTIDELAFHVGSGATLRGGESVYRKEGVLFIRSQNVHFGGLLLADVSYISQKIHDTMKRSEVFENDVLLNITGASIGRCCPMPVINCTANVNQHVCAIRLSKATQSYAVFLTAVIESSIGQNQILQFNAGGNRGGLNYQQVRSFVIPWPKAEERQRLHDVIKESAEALKVSGYNLSKLRSLKTALMQDLLTGKKRVTTLLNDKEAASL